MNDEIIINQKFRNLIPPLAPNELSNLRLSLELDGCRDALLVWRKKNILLDGHNRYEWCKKKGIEFKVEYISCTSEATAEKFIMMNQISRRNLPLNIVSLFQGKMYNNRKKETPNPEGVNQHKEVKGHSDPQPTTAENIAKETGVSEKTVKRNAKYASAVEKLGIEKEIISGVNKKPKTQIVKEAFTPNVVVLPTHAKLKSPGEKVAEQFAKLSWDEMKIASVLKDEIFLNKKMEIVQYDFDFTKPPEPIQSTKRRAKPMKRTAKRKRP